MVQNATYGSLGGLKRRMMEQHGLQFCDLCIKGRKVGQIVWLGSKENDLIE